MALIRQGFFWHVQDVCLCAVQTEDELASAILFLLVQHHCCRMPQVYSHGHWRSRGAEMVGELVTQGVMS